MPYLGITSTVFFRTNLPLEHNMLLLVLMPKSQNNSMLQTQNDLLYHIAPAYKMLGSHKSALAFAKVSWFVCRTCFTQAKKQIKK